MPYEIGANVMGEVNLFLPFSRLTARLRPAVNAWMSP